MNTQFQLRGAAGITFDHCIVVCESAPQPRLLLHELAHVAQYRQLGVAAFTRGYIFGLARASFVYAENPFEQIAFRLDERFAAGHEFNLASEVDRWFASERPEPGF